MNMLQQLEDYEEGFKKYDGKSAEEMQNLVKDETFANHLREMVHGYEEVILKAIRARLDKHPLVQERVKDHLRDRARCWRTLGQWDKLRRAKRGLEKGVKRPLTEEQVKTLSWLT